MKRAFVALVAAVLLPVFALAQGRGGQQPPRSPKDAAPVDLAGYWVSYSRTAGKDPTITITMQKIDR